MKTYSEKDIILKLNEYFKFINGGRPISYEQSQVIGHLLSALSMSDKQKPLNAREGRKYPVRA